MQHIIIFVLNNICITMKFVDRTEESTRLLRAMNSEECTLNVVYGRRRVGKSTLIRRLLRPRSDIYFQADETRTENQLFLLAKAAASVIQDFDRAIYPDWTSMLEALNYRIDQNATLCLDEFPFMVKSCPALPSIIQRFWDSGKSRFNIILCGSSQQAMHSDLLNGSSPLYGRADCILKLLPIAPAYLREAMELSSAGEAVENYAFWGGVPRYWKLCLDEGSLEKGIRRLLLSPDGTLIDEPGRLLRDELRDLTLSRTLLSLIGNGANRLSEIAARAGKPANELAGPLRRLLDLGFIERDTPFGEEEKNSKHSLYRISDPFVDAYYHFVAPNASLIAQGGEDAAWKLLSLGFNAYVGSWWERLCRRAVSGKRVGGILYGAASRWWGQVYAAGTASRMEFDVVARSIEGRSLLVGECKWTRAEDAPRLLAALRAKAALLPFIGSYEHIQYVLFLREPPAVPVEADDCLVLLPDDVIALCSGL